MTRRPDSGSVSAAAARASGKLAPQRSAAGRIAQRQRTISIWKVYQGLVVYEAVDGLMLQTGPAATVRLAGSQIESRGFSDRSLMPAGLLDKLTDGEIADLLAYLKGLGKKN